MPVEGDFEMSCWSFLEIIWFHFWEAVHMEKWCSQTKDTLDWFFNLTSLLLRSRKKMKNKRGKMSNLLGLQQRNPFVLLLCFIYKLTDQFFNNEKMFKKNCVLKCFDLCTLIWIIMTFFYFPFYQGGQKISSLQWKTWRNIGNVSTIKWFCCLWRFLEVAGYLQMGRQSWMLRMAHVADCEDGRPRMFASGLWQLQATCPCL